MVRLYGLMSVLAGVLGGCQFDRPPDVEQPADARVIDALVIDAAQECTPDARSCASGRYTACDASGRYESYQIPNGGDDGAPITLTMNQYECPMGCDEALPQCADIDASNGLNVALDDPAVSATGLDLVLPRSATAPAQLVVIDTSSFDDEDGSTIVTDADGVPVRVPARIVTQTDAPEIMVLLVRSFALREGYTLEVRGLRALAIASHFDVTVDGTIDLSEEVSIGRRLAPGVRTTDAACNGAYASMSAAGGGGGVHDGGDGSEGAHGGFSYVGLSPLVGGCGGGEVTVFGRGNGGGALQVASRTRIALGSSALIDVSGGGGEPASGLVAGGSSGGNVVLEAPALLVRTGSRIAGRGGSGGANGIGMEVHGLEGPTTGDAGAASVTCSACGVSGRGGTESGLPGDGTGSGTMRASGGGSVGRCQTRNRTGVLEPAAGTMKIVHAHQALPHRDH